MTFGKGFSKNLFSILTVIAMGALCAAGAVVLAMPLDESDSPEHSFFQQAQDNTVCETSAVEINRTRSGTDKTLLRQYNSFGTVSRPGVVMPVATLYNAHTRETLPIFDSPKPKPELVRHFFRCRGFGETVDMAPALLDVLLAAARQFQAKRISIISGYRSPKFNDALAKKGRRVAAESRHMKGEAVDFRLDTVEARELGKWLRENFEGGVGTYRADNFVHVDVGPKRSWNGH
ncbi:MAG: YcbK family protein [Deltaproteobacteria bacterium]|nr:YcbK family protein [Deltaproteobacteria bacterium]